ncbi:MAG: carbonic anhydrase [Pseudomonadales bacterium]|jgi:carbonic anhydrase|nr:carbonic anhydrase [Pseudomonadales bacterium]
MSDIDALVSGFGDFKQEYTEDRTGKYRELIDEGARPKIMMVACCDSRVDPAIITNSKAGDIFVVRNVANLVPRYDADIAHSETQAALEYGVCFLDVDHLIVMGHSRCGGIRSLLTRMIDGYDADHPLAHWTGIAQGVAEQVVAELGSADLDELSCECSRRALSVSLQNLMSYPWLRDKVEAGELDLRGWYFNLALGELDELNQETGQFQALC